MSTKMLASYLSGIRVLKMLKFQGIALFICCMLVDVYSYSLDSRLHIYSTGRIKINDPLYCDSKALRYTVHRDHSNSIGHHHKHDARSWLKSSRFDDMVSGAMRSVKNSRYRWLLKYADLRPYSDRDALGIMFLMTNLFYEFVGQGILVNTEGGPDQLLYSVTLQIAGLVSFYYHWAQLHYGPDKDVVCRALLVDYVVASFTIVLFSFRLLQLYTSSGELSMSSITLSSLASTSLLLSWKYEFQLPYILFHGLWHVLSAYSVQQLFP